eukprot:4798833-Amphidinium_carterae.1
MLHFCLTPLSSPGKSHQDCASRFCPILDTKQQKAHGWSTNHGSQLPDVNCKLVGCSWGMNALAPTARPSATVSDYVQFGFLLLARVVSRLGSLAAACSCARLGLAVLTSEHLHLEAPLPWNVWTYSSRRA